jgi:hypothetical protein
MKNEGAQAESTLLSRQAFADSWRQRPFRSMIRIGLGIRRSLKQIPTTRPFGRAALEVGAQSKTDDRPVAAHVIMENGA